MEKADIFKKHSERNASVIDRCGDKLEIQCYSDNSTVFTINHTNAVLLRPEAAKGLRDFLNQRFPK
jgi:hypothetical protein